MANNPIEANAKTTAFHIFDARIFDKISSQMVIPGQKCQICPARKSQNTIADLKFPIQCSLVEFLICPLPEKFSIDHEFRLKSLFPTCALRSLYPNEMKLHADRFIYMNLPLNGSAGFKCEMFHRRGQKVAVSNCRNNRNWFSAPMKSLLIFSLSVFLLILSAANTS